VIVGIDPGVTGAIAWYSGGTILGVADLPVIDSRLIGSQLAKMMRYPEYDILAVFIENTQPMPKNGSIASFKLGLNTGIAIGVVEALGLPLYRPRPAEWKRWTGLIGKDKDAARGLAIERWPDHSSSLARVKDHNRAEAMLIAAYGHHTHQGESAA
jgi:crossover junction endodeoxyribonuclease RuvC